MGNVKNRHNSSRILIHLCKLWKFQIWILKPSESMLSPQELCHKSLPTRMHAAAHLFGSTLHNRTLSMNSIMFHKQHEIGTNIKSNKYWISFPLPPSAWHSEIPICCWVCDGPSKIRKTEPWLSVCSLRSAYGGDVTQLKKQRRRGDEGPQRSSFSDGRLELSSQVLNLLKRSFHKTPVGSGLGVDLKKMSTSSAP